MNASRAKKDISHGLISKHINVQDRPHATTRYRKSSEVLFNSSLYSFCVLRRLSILNEISGEIIEDVNAEREPEQKKIKLNVPKSTTLQDKKHACKYCHMKYTRETYLTKHIAVHGMQDIEKKPN